MMGGGAICVVDIIKHNVKEPMLGVYTSWNLSIFGVTEKTNGVGLIIERASDYGC